MRREPLAIETQSRALIRELARQSNRTLEEAQSAYEMQFQRLESDARVRTYLPILAARYARGILDNH